MPLGALAGAAVQAIAGKAIDIGASSIMSGKQYKKQKKLMDKQRGNQEILMDIAQRQQKEMWDYTNYENQVEHLENAGLNAGLIYGMGGGGGATVGSAGGSAAGGSAAMGDSGQPMDMATIMGITKAQKENIEADTRLKEVEAAKRAGVDTDEGRSRIEQIKAGISNVKAQEALTGVETRLKEMDEKIKGATIDDAIDMVNFSARRALTDLEKATQETYISRVTRNDIIDEIKARAIGQVLQNEATKAGTAVDKAKIDQMSQQIMQGWKGLEQGDTKNAIEKFKAEVQANYPGLWNTIGGAADDALGELYELINGHSRERTKKVGK